MAKTKDVFKDFRKLLRTGKQYLKLYKQGVTDGDRLFPTKTPKKDEVAQLRIDVGFTRPDGMRKLILQVARNTIHPAFAKFVKQQSKKTGKSGTHVEVAHVWLNTKVDESEQEKEVERAMDSLWEKVREVVG